MPLITTLSVSATNESSAECGGILYAEGNSKVTETGLCYSNSSPEPTLNGSKVVCVINGSGFSGKMTNLTAKTQYYVRAYAVNEQGVSYGKSVGFYTADYPPAAPTPTLYNMASTVGFSSAILSGTVIKGGSPPITEVGFCFGLMPNPTTADTKVVSSLFGTTFNSPISSLNGNTSYYARAYVTNSLGIVYGPNFNFKTYYGTVTDIEGNTYYTIKVNNQEWMASNLKVSKYNDGSAITNVTDNAGFYNNTNGAWCNYLNSATNGNVYGKLYNWRAVSNIRGLAPVGWHIPNQDEWDALVNACGSRQNLHESGTTHWQYGYSTNVLNFTALPAGKTQYGFYNLGNEACFWTSTEVSFEDAIMFTTNESYIPYQSQDKGFGYSIRCVKD